MPQSNGKVGMYGFIYQGFTQLQAAVPRGPGTPYDGLRPLLRLVLSRLYPAVEHDRRDAYLEAFNLLNYADRPAEYPMFHIAGWYDYHLRGRLKGYTELSKRKPDRHALVCGP